MSLFHTNVRGHCRGTALIFLPACADRTRLVWLFFLLLYAWPSDCTRHPHPAAPIAPRRKHSADPKPFAGLTKKPHCALCEQDVLYPQAAPCRATRSAATDPSPPSYGGHLAAFLSPCRLSVSRLARTGQSARQRPSQWRPVAPIPVHRV